MEQVLIEVKRKYRDPFIALAGDLNQWGVQDAVQDFVDISEVQVGPTRGDRCIDRFFCNMGRAVSEAGTVPPLESESTKSDHLISYVSIDLPRREAYEWVTYSYRHCTDEAKGDFAEWIIMNDWSDVYLAEGADAKARKFQEHICLLYTSPSPRDRQKSRMPSSA